MISLRPRFSNSPNQSESDADRPATGEDHVAKLRHIAIVSTDSDGNNIDPSVHDCHDVEYQAHRDKKISAPKLEEVEG